MTDNAPRLATKGPEGVRTVEINRVLVDADAANASLCQHFGCKDQLVAS